MVERGAERLLHILMGRARTGKSERVLKRIAALGDTSRQILLVPEHASHVAEMDVCRVCGDTASRHAEVLTFKLLASRVSGICGGSADVTLDNGGKLLTLQRALTELAPALKVYRRASQRAAFLESLLAVMEELQAYAVAPETLLERVADMDGESGDKLRDIALLYGVYLAKLHAPGRDARDALQKLEENLEASGYIDGSDVFLDGFSYFTGRELRILRILLRRANSVTVTLLGDRHDRELFSESLRVREQLLALARDAGVPCGEETIEAGAARGALDHLERCFFGPAHTMAGGTDAVALYEAGSVYGECEWTAAQIARLVREQGYRYRDITVTARELERYAPALQTAFARFDIPLYYAHRSDILQSGVLTLLLGALDAATGGFEYEDVFRCLKTGLAGLTMDECDILENYALKWALRGASWTREAPWAAHPDGYGADWTDEARARLDTVNGLRARIQAPFAHLHQGVGGSGTAADKVRALYAFLDELALSEALQAQTERLFAAGDAQRAEETAQLWSILCGVMDQFVDILGDTALDAEEFAQLFRLVLTQYSVGTIPVTLDAVNLCEMTRNDRHTVRALFLLGANDGVLPAVGTGGGVLRDEDREALEQRQIFLAPHGMAQFHLEIQNLYAALAQPTEKLTVSYPASDGKGGELRPSFVVGRIARLLPDLTEKPARFRYLFERLCAAVERIMDEVADELACSDFEPLAFELQFGQDGALPAIAIRTQGGAAQLRGKVDRVDGWLRDGMLYLRVIDYKTGKKAFDLAELRYGLGLQMLLYLFALEQEGRALFGGREIVPAGVLYTPAREPLLRCARGTEPEKIEKALKKELRRSGMVLGDPAVLRAMEHSALESPCYLPVAVKKDGTVTGGLATAEQLGKLSKYVDHLLGEIAEEIFSGDIDADPCARTPQQTACAYCEFAPACHFENGRGGDRIEYIRATKGEEFWSYIDEVNGEGAHTDG